MLATRSVARQTPRVTSRVRARHSFRASAAMSSSAREKDLQTLWADAYDAWLDVPGEPRPSVVYARPAVPDPRRKKNDASDDPARVTANTAFPAIVTTSRLFALTGFNPMGTKTAMAKNRMANEALREDLASLERPKPRAVWASFGFAHDWREDGFVVAFHEADDVAEARAAIVELAVKYDQGAVYAVPEQVVMPAAVENGIRRRRVATIAIQCVSYDTIHHDTTLIQRFLEHRSDTSCTLSTSH